MAPLLREAWRGLRRDRGLSWIMIAGLAIGVANWQLTELIWRQQHESGIRYPDSLYAVGLVREGRFSEFAGQRVDEITRMLMNTALTGNDPAELSAHPAVTRSVASALGSLAVAPEEGPAEELPVRFTTSALFDLFGLDFQSGRAFAGADEVVITDRLNRRWFPGTDGIGRTVRIGNRRMRVAGVLAPERWPRRYDSRLPRYEELFLPIQLFPALRPWPDPAMANADPGAFFSHPETAPDVWARLFVEVPSERRAEYEAFLGAYVAKHRDRPPRIVSARLIPWKEWEEVVSRAEGIYVVARGMGWLILAGCIFNLIRLALVRSGARAAELGVLRALGESRRMLFGRQLLEASLMGLAAAVAAVVILAGVVPAFNFAIPPKPMDFFVDGIAVASTLACGPVAAALATLYPAWKFTRTSPAVLMGRR